VPLVRSSGTGDLAEVTSVQQRSGPTPRDLAFVAGVSVLALLPFALGMALPYYANDLDSLPLDAVYGLDPETVWPLGTVWGGVAVGLALTLAHPVLAIVTVMAICGTAIAGLQRRPIALGFGALAFAGVTVLTWVWGPTGRALLTWLLD
jgi:hypothetical protein